MRGTVGHTSKNSERESISLTRPVYVVVMSTCDLCGGFRWILGNPLFDESPYWYVAVCCPECGDNNVPVPETWEPAFKEDPRSRRPEDDFPAYARHKEFVEAKVAAEGQVLARVDLHTQTHLCLRNLLIKYHFVIIDDSKADYPIVPREAVVKVDRRAHTMEQLHEKLVELGVR